MVEHFGQSGFTRGFTSGSVILGGGEISAQPVLDMLAISLNSLNASAPSHVLENLSKGFGVEEEAWRHLQALPTYREAKFVLKLKNRCRPKICAKISRTLDEVILSGDTPRSRHVSTYLEQADRYLETAQRVLAEYANNGDEAELDAFIGYVTGSGITSISHTFLFAAFGHDSFTSQDVPPDRLIKLFCRHPIMNRRYFGKLLDLRFKNRSAITGEEVLTGLFQYLGNPISAITGRKDSDLFDVSKLAWCREWARVRLEEWIHKTGLSAAAAVAEAWRDGQAKPAQHPFYPGVICSPESPRNMAEWDALLKEALTWLENRWHEEIGSSRWIAENQLYEILKRRLKKIAVYQHARPTWLAPQHLDVYIPQAGLAIEYMGEQHFSPLDFFGGERAFQERVACDRKKAQLCQAHDIELIQVRYDEDIGERANQIIDRIRSAAPPLG